MAFISFDGFIRTPHPDSDKQFEPISITKREDGTGFILFSVHETFRVKQEDGTFKTVKSAMWKVLLNEEETRKYWSTLQTALKENKKISVKGYLYHQKKQAGEGEKVEYYTTTVKNVKSIEIYVPRTAKGQKVPMTDEVPF